MRPSFFPGVRFRLAAALLAMAPWCSQAMSVTELQTALKGAERVTVIDIRLPGLYRRSHIVGAINVPATVLPHRNLPALGRVVICDGGLGKEDADAALAALAAKPGIHAELLDGGYAAWETAQASTTAAKGIRREVHNQISYAELKRIKGGDVVLVDLRSPAGAPVAADRIAAGGNEPLTDLASEFPGKKISHSPFGGAPAESRTPAGSTTPPLLVLIDSGDGISETMARTLEANGTKRYVILTGGELTLARQGQPGRQRNSPVIHPPPKTTAPTTGNSK